MSGTVGNGQWTKVHYRMIDYDFYSVYFPLSD